MAKIQWTNLPLALRDHLFDRLRERKISGEDRDGLFVEWVDSDCEVIDDAGRTPVIDGNHSVLSEADGRSR